MAMSMALAVFVVVMMWEFVSIPGCDQLSQIMTSSCQERFFVMRVNSHLRNAQNCLRIW